MKLSQETRQEEIFRFNIFVLFWNLGAGSVPYECHSPLSFFNSLHPSHAIILPCHVVILSFFSSTLSLNITALSFSVFLTVSLHFYSKYGWL